MSNGILWMISRFLPGIERNDLQKQSHRALLEATGNMSVACTEKLIATLTPSNQAIPFGPG